MNTAYGATQGIAEQPVVGTTTDEAENLWVATNQALYLLRPGETTFHRYVAADGLHLQSNPVAYCDHFGDNACPIDGAAYAPGITEIVGGAANEVFVGYQSNENGSQDWFDSNRHSGKLDRVRVSSNGKLQVDRFDMVFSATVQFWHNRSVHRLIYDHFLHPHELYVGTNHGVDLMRPDLFRNPNPGEWFNTVNNEWMADHLHPRVCYHAACIDESNQLMGDWYGLALAADGELWVAGRWTAGEIRWDANLFDWVERGGDAAFKYAFGDPYPTAPNAEGFINQPVFQVPLEGDPISSSAVSVCPDGRVWFASGPTYDLSTSPAYGIAVFDGHSFTYFDPVHDAGLGEQNVADLICMPDGRIVVAGRTTGLSIWNPATGTHAAMNGASWLPSDQVMRLELDRMVAPPALHVSTYAGGATLRQLPTP
jgi:hypothetical protein